MKVEFWANWDLEGSFSDNLLVYVSVNNGTTWAPVSGIPGMRRNGFAHQGTYYTDESWVGFPSPTTSRAGYRATPMRQTFCSNFRW